jgi:ketosteroid isomerase-like protein
MNARELVERIVEAVACEDSDAVAALYAEQAILHHPLFPEPAR